VYAPRVIESQPYANVAVTRDLRYGPADRNLLDVLVATEASARPRPVLIFLHGGAFVAGHRRAPGSSHLGALMSMTLRRRG
jgi:carboxylesterase type B